MATITKSKSIILNGKTVKVTLERGTWIEDVRLDGMLCGTKTHVVDRTEIALYDDRDNRLSYGSTLDPMPTRHGSLKQAIEAGCVGIVGSEWFVKAETASAIRAALIELDADNPKTADQIAIETQRAAAKASAEAWLDSDEYRQMVEFEHRMSDPNSDY